MNSEQKKKLLFAFGAALVVKLVLFFLIPLFTGQPFVGMDLSGISDVPPQHEFVIGGMKVQLSFHLLFYTAVVMAVMLLFAFVSTRKMSIIPGKLQSVGELIVGSFDDLIKESLYDFIGKDYRKYVPFILTVFLFVWLSNLIGVVPGLEEPTRNLNVPIALGTMVFFVVHISAIKYKGIKGYLAEYFQPMFFLFPLNVIGELGKAVSLAFRLFGNILGGAIIIIVVSNLARFFFLPTFLNGFFGIFVGTVQAFVFAMLTLTYLAVAVGE